MSQHENYENHGNQNSHHSASRMVRTVAGVAALGLMAGAAVGVYEKVQDFDFSMPWEGASLPHIDISKPKEALDSAMATLSQREAEPLRIDPKDVVMGKVEGVTMYGKAERELDILKAEKKYNSPLPFSDEWVRLENGVYMLESHVGGTARVVMDEHTHKLTVILEQPTNNKDVRVVKDPRPTDRPQALAQLGQLPGNVTSAEAAQTELHKFVEDKQSNDPDLDKAASCWAIKGVGDLTRSLLTASGFDVTMGNKVPAIDYAVAQQNPSFALNQITIDVIGAAKQDHTVVGPTLGESWTSCIPIIEATTPLNGYTTGGVLPTRQTDNVKLKQASK